MTEPDDMTAFDVPAHTGQDATLPCFACWIEQTLQAASEVYDDQGHRAYEEAMTGALRQAAECLGALLAVLAPGNQLLREQFVRALDSAMLFHGTQAGAVQH